MKHLNVKCAGCGHQDVVAVSKKDLTAYYQGALVQDVWPEMAPADREKIIGWRSGVWYCDDCFPKEEVG